MPEDIERGTDERQKEENVQLLSPRTIKRKAVGCITIYHHPLVFPPICIVLW